MSRTLFPEATWNTGTSPFLAREGLERRFVEFVRAAGFGPLRQQHDMGTSPAHFSQGFGNDARVVLVDPLDGRRVCHAHEQRVLVVFDERSRAEPGVETEGRNLRFNPSERVVPNRAGHGPPTLVSA